MKEEKKKNKTKPENPRQNMVIETLIFPGFLVFYFDLE